MIEPAGLLASADVPGPLTWSEILCEVSNQIRTWEGGNAIVDGHAGPPIAIRHAGRRSFGALLVGGQALAASLAGHVVTINAGSVAFLTARGRFEPRPGERTPAATPRPPRTSACSSFPGTRCPR